MSKYDGLFDETVPSDSVFADKGALDPLAEPDEIIARDKQERELATILNGVNEGDLPPTVSIHGPPGTGKTLTTRRVCHEFASRHADVAVAYVNRTAAVSRSEIPVEGSCTASALRALAVLSSPQHSSDEDSKETVRGSWVCIITDSTNCSLFA